VSIKLIFKWYPENKRLLRFARNDTGGKRARDDTGVLMGMVCDDAGREKDHFALLVMTLE